MHGIISGAILGVAVIAFIGVYRSIGNWKTTKRRPPGWVLGIQVGLQLLLGFVALFFALWIMFVGA
ncbi:MAG: hypothetical protein KDB68_16580 [Planctomycetes bacterium]|nr:hypothetical protein [Planctomycetota bacterium]MCA8937804.1 hypothetical protein [Planctomycetota bacterium]MCA8944923.1 hypothetical protein [Planctomycetota bacterium]